MIVEEEIDTEDKMSEKKRVVGIDIGICQYCKMECNPASQACGYCMRNENMKSLGMKKSPAGNLPPWAADGGGSIWRKLQIIDFSLGETKEKETKE